MDAWNTYELQSVCSRLSSGKGICAKDISETGKYPVYGGDGIRGYTDTYNFDGECAVIGRQGANCGNVRFFSGKAYMTEHAVVVCANENNHTRFLSYLLSTMQLGRLSGQSAQPGLAVKTLGIQPVCVPKLDAQKRIASVLGALDDKIALNQQINKNLEEQAQAIYKAWFVNFEPFGGEMPSNWSLGTLEDLGNNIVCGKTPSTKRKEYYDGEIPFVTIPDMHDQIFITETERYLSNQGAEAQPTKTLVKNSVCVSCIGTAGLVSLISRDSQTNQQINSITPKDGISPYYVYFLMKSLSETIRQLGASGSTIVNLNKRQFAKIEATIPSVEVMNSFNAALNPVFELILSNQQMNIRLSVLRDTLLPRLMSGEIDASGIEM